MSRNYSRKDTPVSSDLALIWDAENSDWRLTTLSAVSSLSLSSTPSNMKPVTQYAAPSATAFNVSINNDNKDVHLILSPAATYATGAITLPQNSMAIDKQTVLVNCTQQVTTFSVNLNGADAVYGAPSSLGADDFFTLKYDVTLNSWYRVG